jgi:serine/threonine-protein phosphatase 2B catalytic subunit
LALASYQTDKSLREESEKVSELKSISGSSKLPYGTLALGTEGIKDAISGFEDAYEFISFSSALPLFIPSPHRRKSDIENERLPPELFDAEEAKAYLAQAQSGSLPTTPATEGIESPVSPTGASGVADPSMSSGSLTSIPSLSSLGQIPPPGQSRTPFKGRHGRQASLGTTMTSPSMRRRSLESTISMIQEALDGKDLETNGAYPGEVGGGGGGHPYS